MQCIEGASLVGTTADVHDAVHTCRRLRERKDPQAMGQRRVHMLNKLDPLLVLIFEMLSDQTLFRSIGTSLLSVARHHLSKLTDYLPVQCNVCSFSYVHVLKRVCS